MTAERRSVLLLVVAFFYVTHAEGIEIKASVLLASNEADLCYSVLQVSVQDPSLDRVDYTNAYANIPDQFEISVCHTRRV